MGALNTTYTFSASDTITSDKLNNIIDQSFITSEAIIGSTLAIASNKLKVSTSGITSLELAQDSVTAIAITNGCITIDKLSTGAPVWTSSGNLTIIGTVAMQSNVTITGITTLNGDYTNFGTAPFPKPTGTAPIYGVRSFGTVTSTGSELESSKGNAQSVSRSGVGAYTVTFNTPMLNTSYAVLTTSRGASDSTWVISVGTRTLNTFSVVARYRDSSGDIKAGDVDFSFIVIG